MAQQTINVGTAPNDGTGTPLRTAFQYTNSNFTELYTAVGPSGNNIVCPGTLTVSAGTLALPSLTTAGDTNTGIYFPAADTIGFVEGGVEVMRINSSGNLVVNNAATITGAASVGTTLGVTGVSTFAAGTALLPGITTTGDTNTGIYFPAADTFAVTTGGSERCRVDSSGNFGLGVTPSARFDSLVADATESARFRAASGWLRIHPYLNATDVCRLQSTNNTNTGLQTLTLEGFSLRFNANSGTAVIIDNLMNTVSNVNSAVPSLGTNNTMVFNLTSNTNLRISVRGSDGVTRTTNLTLA